jgi:hypothetical protein
VHEIDRQTDLATPVAAKRYVCTAKFMLRRTINMPIKWSTAQMLIVALGFEQNA